MIRRPERDARRFPALALWRREVCAGVAGQRADAPGSWRHDVLWLAACWEQAAAEALAAGAPERARDHLQRARDVLGAGRAAA
jgi:hypothetical protein